MRKLSINLAVTFHLLLAAALADPKAYELVKYRGHADGVTIAFDFGDGYPEGSEIRLTEHAKSTVFRLAGSESMRFVPAHNNKDGGEDEREVVLKMSPDDAAPAKVAGSYTSHGKTLSFTLTR
jgi:hypothetical protein